MTVPIANLFDPPPKYFLPLSKGGDLVVDFRNNPSGDGETFVGYEDGAVVKLVIDTSPPVEATAIIDTYHAYIKVESDIVDGIDAGVLWRVIVSAPTSPTTETVGANGRTKRFDGL